MIKKILLITLSAGLTGAALHAMQTSMVEQNKDQLQNRLNVAIKNEDIAEINQAIADGADINAYIDRDPSKPSWLATPLIEATKANDLESVNMLLGIPGIDTNIQEKWIKWFDGKTKYDQTALGIAVDKVINMPHYSGDKGVHEATNKIILLLLKHGADPEIKNYLGESVTTRLDPKTLSSSHYNLDHLIKNMLEIKKLVTEGRADYLKKQKETKQHILQEIKTAAATTRTTALSSSPLDIIAEYTDVAEYMRTECEQENAQEMRRWQSEKRKTRRQEQLLAAIQKNDPAAIKMAVAAGADINTLYIPTRAYYRYAYSQRTPTSIFSELIYTNYDLKTLHNLFNYFPHVNINDPLTMPHLNYQVGSAIKYKKTEGNFGPENFDIIQLLLSKGLDVNLQFAYNIMGTTTYTTLFYGIYYFSLDYIEPHTIEAFALFMRYGANPNIEKGQGNTLLNIVLRGIDQGLRKNNKLNPYVEELVKLLLQYGADPKIKNEEGKLPIDYVPEPYKAHFNAILESGHAAYLKKLEETKHHLLQESKTAAEGAGEHGLPGGVAGIVAQYAVGPQEIAAAMHAECAREAATQAQEEKKTQGKIKTDKGS